MKWCNQCSQWKELDEFYNHKKSKDGKDWQCKECNKQKSRQYRENNREYLKQYHKEYYESNKDHIKQNVKEYRENNKEYKKEHEKQRRENNKEYYKQLWKQYRENNKEYRKQYGKQYRNSPMSYNENLKSIQIIRNYEDIAESENGNLMCKCDYCNEWFEPTRREIDNRLNAIRNGGCECRLYCSDECKQNCPIFNQVLHPKDQKPYEYREIQKEVRDMRIEVDNYTCQNCKTHQGDLEYPLECHHIYPINESPITSGDIDECKMVCRDCHQKIHQQPGCTHNELKCTYEGG